MARKDASRRTHAPGAQRTGLERELLLQFRRSRHEARDVHAHGFPSRRRLGRRSARGVSRRRSRCVHVRPSHHRTPTCRDTTATSRSAACASTASNRSACGASAIRVRRRTSPTRRFCSSAASCGPEGWYRDAQLDMSVDFRALTEPHYAASGSRGHFEQTGQVRGEITHRRANDTGIRLRRSRQVVGSARLGCRRAGASLRRRDETVRPRTVRQLVLDELRRRTRARRFVRTRGRRRRCAAPAGSTTTAAPKICTTSSSTANTSRIRFCTAAVRLTGRAASGRKISVDGRVLTVCPTKIPMPGGATFVNEGLAEFRCDGLTGYGISEHWHRVTGAG